MPEAAVRPPALTGHAADPLLALADQCVQCGLCLPSCPTYRLDLLEAESPRGRIALARAWALDTAAPTATGDRHLDQCLGCRRCEVVCPAGVQYGDLLVAARARQRQRRPAGRRQRATEWLTARPRLLKALLTWYRRAWPLLPAAWRPLPRPPATRSSPVIAGSGDLALFVGCVAIAYETSLREATARLCAALGLRVSMPGAQTCCGALHAHAGNVDAAAALGGRNRAAFARTGHVLTLASGCHEAVAAALRETAPVTDALAFLARHADSLQFHECRERIALHLPCTQRNLARSDAATRMLLARVPGLTVVELDAGPLSTGMGCCGAAGTAMLADPARAARFRQPLLEQLAASGATRLLNANLGCRLHFANATPLPVQHPLEFLAEYLQDSK